VSWQEPFEELRRQGRATVLTTMTGGPRLWVAAERTPQLQDIFAEATLEPAIHIPERMRKHLPVADNAVVEIVRSRLEALGPVRPEDVVGSMGVDVDQVNQALLALENEGFVFRGQFTPGSESLEWCERRLLARIHRYTIARLRREIEPVSSAHFMRFLFAWHRLGTGDLPDGPDALHDILRLLEGFEAPAAAWEGDLLPARMQDYDYAWLDTLCLSGRVLWGRFRPPSGNDGKPAAGPIKSSPIIFADRANVDAWKWIHRQSAGRQVPPSAGAEIVRDVLHEHGASFFDEIVARTGLLTGQVEEALSELTSLGVVTADSFTGLRALLVDSKYQTRARRRRQKHLDFTMELAGRWAPIERRVTDDDADRIDDDTLETIAHVLLRRYGVVFRRLVDREQLAPPWRDLVRVMRRLEARGEIRGGRFVEGVWGEQYALSEAVAKLRAVRKEPPSGRLVSISAADPLNLTGIITPGRRVSGLFTNRILYKDGVPIAIKEGKEIRFLARFEKKEEWELQSALVQRSISPRLRPYLGKGIG
jgi:ATP-dependent Lhr-like helicase